MFATYREFVSCIQVTGVQDQRVPMDGRPEPFSLPHPQSLDSQELAEFSRHRVFAEPVSAPQPTQGNFFAAALSAFTRIFARNVLLISHLPLKGSLQSSESWTFLV